MEWKSGVDAVRGRGRMILMHARVVPCFVLAIHKHHLSQAGFSTSWWSLDYL